MADYTGPVDVAFYRPKNHIDKKEWELKQKNEYTHVNKYMEGLCYICDEYKFVVASQIDVCFECLKKHNRHAILNVISPKIDGYCMLCGTYPKITHKWNIMTLNIRRCESCTDRVINKGKRAGGNPTYKSMRRIHGKDFETHLGIEGFGK